MSDQNDHEREQSPDVSSENYDGAAAFNNQAYDFERKRGILTKKDRKYIVDELDIDGQKEYNLLFRLRERVKNGILDIQHLTWLDDEEFRKVSDSLRGHDFISHVGPMFLTRFLHKFTRNHPAVDNTHNRIETALEHTIRNHLIEKDVASGEGEAIRSVSVNIEVEREDRESFIESLARGEVPHQTEFVYLSIADLSEIESIVDAAHEVSEESERPVTRILKKLDRAERLEEFFEYSDRYE